MDIKRINERLKELVSVTKPTGICEICTSNVIKKYEYLQARVQELEQELENKCANCGLASHNIWGDEDNVYDNLSTEEE